MAQETTDPVVRVRDRTFRPYIRRDEIATMVASIAEQINASYAGRELTMLVILRGAMVFASDLMRALNMPVTVETLRASSYQDAMTSIGKVTVEDIVPDVAGRDVLIVEDIIDSGGEGTNHWYHVILKEGKNREVRRLWEAVGVEVSRLVRVRYDSFNLPKWLKPGKHRFLDDAMVMRLYQKLGLDYKASVKSRNTRSRK